MIVFLSIYISLIVWKIVTWCKTRCCKKKKQPQNSGMDNIAAKKKRDGAGAVKEIGNRDYEYSDVE